MASLWVGIFFCAAFLAWRSQTARTRATDILSAVINAYLLWKFPVRHAETGEKIPTCQYRFPNGQGDVEKFLVGLSNSDNWGSINGPIYRIWSGMRPEIVLTRPEQIKIVFKDSDQHSKAVNNNSGYFMSQILGKCVGLISGHEWRAVRTAVEVPFTRKASFERMEIIQHWVERHMAELWQHGHLPKGLLEPADDLKMLPFWITAEVFYGKMSPEQILQLRELAAMREDLFKIVIHGGLARFKFSRYIPTQANKKLTRFQTSWRNFNDQAYYRAISNDLAPPIVQMYQLCENGTITQNQLLHTIDESLFANLDVTTGGFSWVLVFLAANKYYQTCLLSELDTYRKEHQGDRKPYILANGTLLASCIAESCRLRPLAAFSVPQSAPTSRVVGGYMIPAGTDFIVDTYGLNTRNETFWGPDASVFRPERFLEHSKQAMDLRYQFWRFGFGPRQCMGKYLADLMTRAFIIHIVESYELSLLDGDVGKDWCRIPDVWISHPNMQLRCLRRT